MPELGNGDPNRLKSGVVPATVGSNPTSGDRVQEASAAKQPCLLGGVRAMNPDKPHKSIESEIEKCFGEIPESETLSISKFVGQLELQGLEERILQNYNGKPRKHSPIRMVRIVLFKDLYQINSRVAALERLRNREEERRHLGYNSAEEIPSPQSMAHFLNNKVDAETRKAIEYAVSYTRERNKDEELIYNIHYEDEEEEDVDEVQQLVDKKSAKVRNFLRLKVFPKLSFRRADNKKYDNLEMLDLLTFTAMRNVCTNEGYNLMTGLVDKDVPHARTLRHHISDMDRSSIYTLYEEANQRILDAAKDEGRLEHEVDVAIDFTNVMYYGDKNDEMVTEVHPKDGTSHAFQFGTLKIVSGGEHYTLLAVPVSKLRSKEAVVEKLLEQAEEVVEIKRVYLDRGFFTTGIMNLLESRGHRFLMPAVRNSRVKRRMEEVGEEKIERYTMDGKGGKVTFNLVFREGKDGDLKPFATNCNPLEILTNDLFELYGRRWDIETGFRVQKENFYPKTTSKDYNIRLFYFLFSQILYNAWILTNIVVSLSIHSEIREGQIITAQEFITRFFRAFVDYG